MDDKLLDSLLDLVRALNQMITGNKISDNGIRDHAHLIQDFIKLSGISYRLELIDGLYHLFDDAGRLLI